MDAFHSRQIRPLRPLYGDTWKEGLKSVNAGTHQPAPAPVDEYGNEIKHPWYKPTRKSADELRADMLAWGKAIEKDRNGSAERHVDAGPSVIKPVSSGLVSGHRPTKTIDGRASDASAPYAHGWTVSMGVGASYSSSKASAV